MIPPEKVRDFHSLYISLQGKIKAVHAREKFRHSGRWFLFTLDTAMHELSLMTSIMDIAQQEMQKHGACRLRLIRVRHGELDQVQPDAMHMAFEAMTANTPHEGARLELVEETLEICCSLCGHMFHPQTRYALYEPCPSCGEQAPFRVSKGEGIFLDHLEAE